VLTIGINRTGDGIPANFWPEGAGYTQYKWRLDTNAWSLPVDIDTPISLTNLSDGPHFVEVSGLRDSGWFQDDERLGTEAYVSRSATWTVASNTPDLEISEVKLANGKVELHFVTSASQTYSILSRNTLNS